MLQWGLTFACLQSTGATKKQQESERDHGAVECMQPQWSKGLQEREKREKVVKFPSLVIQLVGERADEEREGMKEEGKEAK